jgi:hypothetical protein
MTRPNKQIQNLSLNIKDELEHLRNELIKTFFQSAITHIDIIIKRKVFSSLLHIDLNRLF